MLDKNTSWMLLHLFDTLYANQIGDVANEVTTLYANSIIGLSRLTIEDTVDDDLVVSGT